VHTDGCCFAECLVTPSLYDPVDNRGDAIEDSRGTSRSKIDTAIKVYFSFECQIRQAMSVRMSRAIAEGQLGRPILYPLWQDEPSSPCQSYFGEI